MKKPFRIALAVLVTLGVAGGLVTGFLLRRGELEKEQQNDAPIKPPQKVEMDRDGEPIITLDDETMDRISIEAITLSAVSFSPSVVAYGRLEVDPARSYTLRAPFAGIIRAPAAGHWPGLGAALEQGQEVGALAPRLMAVERTDIAARLAAARAEALGAEASAAAARAAYSRAQRLVAEKNISERVFQEAEARVRSEEARLAGARESARILESALTGTTLTAAPLLADRAGQVVEVLAQPGEAVESGQPILRLARFDRLLARVELPLGTHADGQIERARVAVLGREETPLDAEPIARTGSVDGQAQSDGFLLRVSAGALPLRPGTAVTAWLELPGGRIPGVVIPRDAIVRLAGKAWAYSAIGPQVFSRHEVELDHPSAGGWFVTRAFKPGDRVIASGAGALLSEELKPTIDMGD